MASYTTSFYDDDEEAPWQALLGHEEPELGGPAPELAPSPALQTRAAEPERESYQPPQRLKSDDDDGGDTDILIAGLLDVVLNKGKNLGTMVQQKTASDDHKRRSKREDEQHAQRMEYAQMGMGPRGGRLRGPGGMTPEQLALRQRYAQIAEDRAKTSKNREDRLSGRPSADARADLGEPPAPDEDVLTQFAQLGGDAPPVPGAPEEPADEQTAIDEARWSIANMDKPPKPGAATPAAAGDGDGLTAFQRESLRLREAEIEAKKAAGKGKPRPTPDAARAAGEAAAHEPQFTDKQYADIAGKVWKDTEYLRSGASFLQGAEGVVAKYKEGDDLPGAGTWDSSKPARLLDEDGAKIRSAQQWMNNAIQRAESGAAAPIAEEVKIAMRNGANKGASEAEFRTGLAAARQFLRGELSSAAAGREAIARDVYRRQGIEDWVFGGELIGGGDDSFNPPPPAQPEPPLAGPPAGDTLDVTPAAKATAKIPAAQGGGMVAMVDPDTGVMRMVPASKVAEAEKRGLQRAQ